MKPTAPKKFDVYGIGNAIVDMEFEVTEAFIAQCKVQKGLRTCINEVRQAELLGSLTSVAHKRTAGCASANKMIALAQFGGKSFFSCKFPNDEPGKFFHKDLERLGVETGLTSDALDTLGAGITGTCIVLVTPDGDRTMNTYLGTTSDYAIKNLSQENLKDSSYIYIEGYLLTDPISKETMIEARKIASANGVKTAISFSDVNVVKAFSREFKEVIGEGVDIIFCNEGEAYAYTGAEDLEGVAASLKKISKTFAVTLGPKGAMVFDGQEVFFVPAMEVKAVDTIGAGDCFAGTMLYGINNGMTFEGAARLGCTAASILVTQFGARLSQEQVNSIKSNFQP